MTYAESLEIRIAQQAAELRRVLSNMDDVVGRSSSGEWSADEILVHLLGATKDTAAGIERALAEHNPSLSGEQPGGQYLDMPGAGSREDLLRLLLSTLEQISDTIRGLDDDTLRRPVTIALEEAEPMTDVPMGIWLRYAVGDHFDAHLDQLRALVSGDPPSVDASTA